VYEADTKEREEFRMDVGEYLTVDLWTGVNSSPRKWEYILSDGQEGEGARSVPELERAVVEAAGRRDRERQRAER
jgi:autophagy-related protein 17